MKKSRIALISSAVIILILITIALPQAALLAKSGDLVNPGFETGDFTGWTNGTVSEGVFVVGADGFATPPEGSFMARLGKAAADRDIDQTRGPNQIYQNFTASESSISFVYNIFTWDYQGFNHFEYQLRTRDTSDIIDSYSQGAWGSGTGLKSTGWQKVTLDISGYSGRPLQLRLDCGGTWDSNFPTWAYIDVSAPVTPSKVEVELPIGGSITLTKEATTPPGQPSDVWTTLDYQNGLTVTLSPYKYNNVPGGTLLTFQETITVDDEMALQGGTLDGTITFYSGMLSPVLIGEQQIIVHVLGSDLSITKEGSSDNVVVGSDLTYHIVVTNKGPSRCADVVMNDTLPVGLIFVSASASKGIFDENTGNWYIGEMAPLDVEEIDIVVNAGPITPVGYVTNVARVTGPEPDWYDPVIYDNTARVRTRIIVTPMGGEVISVNKKGLLVPWVNLAVVILGLGIYWAGRRFSSNR
jgi:uncharacterized repeat protein (TIGR01451 family)